MTDEERAEKVSAIALKLRVECPRYVEDFHLSKIIWAIARIRVDLDDLMRERGK